MRKQLTVVLLCSAVAFASGTVTPGARGGGNRCATSTIEGTISKVDVESKMFSVAGAKGEARDFKVGQDAVFRIPGATKEELKNAPLSKVTTNARVKVFYCSKDGSPVEVKIER
jgi:hypothetical protein